MLGYCGRHLRNRLPRQDLEASKALPEIWAELRKKDNRVLELEAKLQLTEVDAHPGMQAQSLEAERSAPVSPFKEAVTQAKLRDLEAQLREKDQQVCSLHVSVCTRP